MSKKKYVQKKGVKPYSIPIEYRKLTREDFLPEDVYQQFEKVEIEADTNGYVKDAILDEIDDESDTTVINVGTGQGKTTAIIEKIKDFYNEGYFIIVASPTKSLVGKYHKSIKEELKGNVDSFTEGELVDYQKIIEGFNFISTHKILIGTINLLLGNPGEEGFLQSQPKRNYLNDVIQYYWNKDKKVIIIFDEIHEGVQNFTSKLYPNLLTLRNAVHKILVLSATYTEPAIVVLKLLASLTGNRIKVVESKRLKVGKQASLSLVFIREEYTSTDIEPLNILNSNIQIF